MTNLYASDSLESATNRNGMKSPSQKSIKFLHQFARACTAIPGIAPNVMIAN